MATHASYDTELRRLYQRAYRAAGKDAWVNARKQASITDAPFVGIDGEGGNLANGYHAYFLLSAGDRSIVPSGGNTRLTTRESLAFLCDLDPSVLYCVYFGDYDVTKMLEDVPFEKLDRLMDRSKRRRKDGKGVFPVSYGEFEFDYLPRKEFKVRRNGGRWIVINDVGSFFQCRFVEALEKWDVGTAEERAAVAAGKEQRGAFDFADIESIRAYNLLEIRLLEDLMEKFRAACIQVECVPARWQGPGQLAEALFARHGVPRTRDLDCVSRYPELFTFAANAFYGGRPEISVIGPVDVPARQADINSAYPHAMRYVPCLVHGTWVHKTVREEDQEWTRGSESFTDAKLTLRFGSFRHAQRSVSLDTPESPPMFFGLPMRGKEGTITYPANGRGWYWGFEVDASIHQEFKCEERWTYETSCDCRWLSFTESVYRQRKAMGKDGPGIVLKLGLNSLYGKTVQSIGSPTYANPIWGSFITAVCRTMVQAFIHSSPLCTSGHCGQDILMIATDSVMTTSKPEEFGISIGSELGEWSVEEHPTGVFIVQPGLYFGSSGKKPKTRGVPASVIGERLEDFRGAFNRMVASRNPADGDVRVAQQMFVGIRYALHRHNVKLLGQWIDFIDPETGETGKRICFDWHSKRAAFPVLEPVNGRTWLTTFPQWGSTETCTVPYSRDIGGIQTAEMLRTLFEAQPDWGQDLVTGFADNR